MLQFTETIEIQNSQLDRTRRYIKKCAKQEKMKASYEKAKQERRAKMLTKSMGQIASGGADSIS